MEYIINEIEIKKSIVQLLTNAGFNVTAAEINEGLIKPAVFVDVLPSSVSLLNASLEEVTDTVEIKYIPYIETYEHCLETAQAFRNILFYNTINVGKRRLTVNEIFFEVENEYVLKVSFDLVYRQATSFPKEDYEDMEELELGGDV